MKKLLVAFGILLVASTPGAMESYLAWRQYPETRRTIVLWYGAVALFALFAVYGSGKDGV